MSEQTTINWTNLILELQSSKLWMHTAYEWILKPPMLDINSKGTSWRITPMVYNDINIRAEKSGKKENGKAHSGLVVTPEGKITAANATSSVTPEGKIVEQKPMLVQSAPFAMASVMEQKPVLMQSAPVPMAKNLFFKAHRN